MKPRPRRPPVHPFLLVAYFFAFLYGNNLGRVTAGTLAWPLALAFAVVGVLYLVLFQATRDLWRAALLTSLLVLLFFAYGHAYGWIYATVADVSPLLLHLLLTQAFLALLLVGQLAIRKARDLAKPTIAAHRMAGLLLLMAVAPILAAGPGGVRSGPDPATMATTALPVEGDAGPETPDIYLIVLDSYARQDVLEEHYGFDNRATLDSLRTLGFQVATDSRSNYAWTLLSLPSLLNMQYLDELTSSSEEDVAGPLGGAALIRENEVVRQLRRHGYRYVHFSSTFSATRSSPLADEEVTCQGIGFREEAYRALVESTWLRILDFAVAADLASCHLSQFEQLAALSPSPDPTFVFAHFIPPHHPYLFDREGRVLRRATIANQMQHQKNLWADRDGYLDQLRFINDRILHVVGHFLEDSERERVIVLMSDHGPQLPGTDRQTFLHARFANLTAVHLPDGGRVRSDIPDDITPVNVFRLLLARYLGSDLKPLPNRYLYSPFMDGQASIDVTRELTGTRTEATAAPDQSPR